MLMVAGAAPAGAQACATSAKAGTAFFIEPTRPGVRDTLIGARLCVTSVTPVGSYTAVVAYDSTRVRVARVETAGDMQVSNTQVTGIVRFAGASPGGFRNGVLATIFFKPVAGRTTGRIAVTISEVSSTNGASLLADTRTVGWPVATKVAARPVIDSIIPRAAEISHERVTDVVLYGKGFTESGNSVDFGGAEVSGLASEKGGTVIRFLAPTEVPAKGARQMQRLAPGRIQVRVRHGGGSSNPVTFTVRGDS
jgi:hypothetical protein